MIGDLIYYETGVLALFWVLWGKNDPKWPKMTQKPEILRSLHQNPSQIIRLPSKFLYIVSKNDGKTAPIIVPALGFAIRPIMQKKS